MAPPLDSRPPSVALVSSPSGQRCEAAVRWRRLSTRDARPSPLVSVAVSTAARRAAVRWTAARRGSSALAPPLNSRRPSVASCLIAACTVARRAAARWTTARRASCVLAPPLDSRRPSVVSRLCRRLDSGAAGRLCAGAASRLEASVRRLSSHRRLDSCATRRLYAGAAPRLEAPVRRLSSHRRLDSGAASSGALDSGAARQQCAGAASRLETPVRRLSSPSPPGQRRGGAAVRWRRLSTRGLRPSPLVSSPSGQLCDEAVVRWRRPSTRGPRPSPLVSSPSGQWRGEQRCSGAARQQCTGAASRLETPVRRLSSRRRLDSGAASSCALDGGAASQLRAGAASRLEAPVRRLPSLSPPGQRRGEAAVRWRHLSTRDTRPSPLVSAAASTAARRGSCALDSGAARQQCAGAASRLETPVRRRSSLSPPGQRRGEAAVRWRRLSTRGLRPSRLSHRRLDSGAARRLCAGAASRLETPVHRRSSPPPPVQQRGEQPCAGQRRGEAAVRWRRLRLVASVRRLLSHRRLYSGAASSCALDGGAASQLRAGAAPRLETPVRRLSSLSPPGQRRGGAAVRWRRLSTRGARPSPLVSSASGQWRGEQRCAGQRRS